MKIVFLMHSYFGISIGGAEYQVSLLAKELAKLNHDIHFVFLKDRAAVDSNAEWQASHLYPIVKTTLKDLSTLKVSYYYDVYSRLKLIKPDVIYHRNLSPFLFAATMYAKTSGAKTILHISHMKDVEKFRLWARDRSLLRGFDDYFKFQGLKQVDSIISQTYEQKIELYKNYGKDSIVVRNFAEQAIPFDVRSKENIVAWIANIKPFKNPFPFMDLSNTLEDTGYRFLMIGRPPSGKFSKEFKERLSNSKVEYLGEQTKSEVEKILAKAKILCCTSYAEGFPNTFLQAWVRQVPVVSLHVDPDNILMKENIGVKAGSFDRFVQNVKVLMQNNYSREEMGKKASEYVKSNHSVEINLPKIVRVIES